MDQMNNLPRNASRDDIRSADEVLRTVTQDLQHLQQYLSSQLSKDVERLQIEKSRLMRDIDALYEDYQTLQARNQSLQAQNEAALSRQQVAQQQLWAKRLAQTLAHYLRDYLTQSAYGGAPGLAGGNYGQISEAQTLLASLDTTLNSTLQSLQQDLNTYQSSLSQQIGRMHSMEQQGEAILEALVGRLSQQLQTQVARPQPALHNAYPNSSVHHLGLNGTAAAAPSEAIAPTYGTSRSLSSTTSATPSVSPAADSATAAGSESVPSSQQLSRLQRGMVLILFSTLALAFHNVVVGVLGTGGNLLGRIPVDNILQLSLANSTMLLFLRMLVVLPLMLLIAPKLYPPVWRDVNAFLESEDRRPLGQVISSGCFLFISQVLIYTAIPQAGVGVAVTLLFVYPLVTVPLGWVLFGDRPSALRMLVVVAIAMGVVFTALPQVSLAFVTQSGFQPWGVVTALGSSVAFALYLISMQLSFRKLHPVPVSLFQFATIFGLTSLALVFGAIVGFKPTPPSNLMGLLFGGFLLGGLTLLGYLFNSYGGRLMGSAQASIIASSCPIISAILACIVIPGPESALELVQWAGVMLVTLGVSALSFERLTLHGRKTRILKVRT